MAKKTNRLSIHLTNKEQIWAIIYLLFSYALLPELIHFMNGYLPTPLNKVWINFLYFSINFVMTIWIFGGYFRRSLIYAGQNIPDFLGAVVAASVVYWLCNWGISWLFGRFFPDYVNLNDSSVSDLVGNHYAIMFIATVFFVPVAEEALHRGLIFGCLYPKNHIAAYVLSTAIFASVHILGYVGLYSLPHLILAFIQYMPAGLTLAWAYRKSGSIFAPIVMHAVINTVGMLAQQ